jgi:CRISPR system Cascade subunit CasB
LLDADRDQLPHRLRQMIALLKDFPIDFESLLESLIFWNDDRKRTQTRWAREFYRKAQSGIEVNESCHEGNTP